MKKTCECLKLPDGWKWLPPKHVEGGTIFYATDSDWEARGIPPVASTSQEDVARTARIIKEEEN